MLRGFVLHHSCLAPLLFPILTLSILCPFFDHCYVHLQLAMAPRADELLETAMLELGTTTKMQHRLKSRVQAKVNTMVRDDDRCRVLLNTWIGKCVFAV